MWKPSHSVYVAPIFLAVQPFSYNSAWFAGIYVRFRKLFFGKSHYDDYEDVKFIIATMVRSVPVAVWHYECHQVIKEIGKG